MKKKQIHRKIHYSEPMGQNNIHYSFGEIICNDDDPAKVFYESICKFCISDLQKSKGVTVEMGEIDFQMISLVDAVW